MPGPRAPAPVTARAGRTAFDVPVAIGVDLPAIAAETVLTADQRRALDADLAADR